MDINRKKFVYVNKGIYFFIFLLISSLVLLTIYSAMLYSYYASQKPTKIKTIFLNNKKKELLIKIAKIEKEIRSIPIQNNDYGGGGGGNDDDDNGERGHEYNGYDDYNNIEKENNKLNREEKDLFNILNDNKINCKLECEIPG